MSNSMIEGRRADSARRCQRVIKAINTSRSSGAEISVSAIARLAGVDRSFLYRHKDLLAQIHTAQIVPVSGDARSRVTSESLKADLANAQQRIVRLAAHNRQLERRLSEMLGEQAWRESGLGARLPMSINCGNRSSRSNRLMPNSGSGSKSVTENSTRHVLPTES
jgi:hypothetical protein